MERKLELKDIAGYLPYGIYAKLPYGMLIIGNHPDIHEADNLVNYGAILRQHNNYKPILRPLSDMYKTITHNGEEIVPILKLANISYSDDNWCLNDNRTRVIIKGEYSMPYKEFGYSLLDNHFFIRDQRAVGDVHNQHQLFDYCCELKLDVRGLIDAGLAIDVNTLDINPYK